MPAAAGPVERQQSPVPLTEAIFKKLHLLLVLVLVVEVDPQ